MSRSLLSLVPAFWRPLLQRPSKRPPAMGQVDVPALDGVTFLNHPDLEQCCALLDSLLEGAPEGGRWSSVARCIGQLASPVARRHALNHLACRVGPPLQGLLLDSDPTVPALLNAFQHQPRLAPVLAMVGALLPSPQQGRVLESHLARLDVAAYRACTERFEPRAPLPPSALDRFMNESSIPLDALACRVAAEAVLRLPTSHAARRFRELSETQVTVAHFCFAEARASHFYDLMKDLRVEDHPSTQDAVAMGLAQRPDLEERTRLFSNMMWPFAKTFVACLRRNPSLPLWACDWRRGVRLLKCEKRARSGRACPELDAAYLGARRVPKKEHRIWLSSLVEFPALDAYLQRRIAQPGPE